MLPKENQEACNQKARGTKYEVFNGLAKKTAGGLCKEDLMLNKNNQVISKKRHEQGKKAFKNIEHLVRKDKKEKLDEDNNNLEEENKNNNIIEEKHELPLPLAEIKEEKKEEAESNPILSNPEIKIRKRKNK